MRTVIVQYKGIPGESVLAVGKPLKSKKPEPRFDHTNVHQSTFKPNRESVIPKCISKKVRGKRKNSKAPWKYWPDYNISIIKTSNREFMDGIHLYDGFIDDVEFDYGSETYGEI